MIESKANHQVEQLVQRIDPQSKLLRTWALKGGVSAQVTAFEIERPDGQTQKMIVRRHGDLDLQRNPRIATDEFKLLKLLQDAGLPAPAPYYVDESGEIFGRPCIVMEYIEGKPEFAPSDLTSFMIQRATTLTGIHRLDEATHDLSFLPEVEAFYTKKPRERPAKIDESIHEGRIRDTLEAAWPLSRRNPSALLHGDFWPGNLLCRNGRLLAVIDWEDAASGDPLADLANSRLEILWAFGLEAMNRFTQQYQSLMPSLDFTDLPYWDLCAALRRAGKITEWAGDEITERRMRERHRLFVTQAFRAKSGK